MFEASLLRNKRILVTGGGTGLGYAMANRFLELGAHVFICGRRPQVLEEAARALEDDHNGAVTPLTIDIRNAEAVDEMIGEIWSSGPLDGLVNNAAGNFISRTEDLSPRGFDAIANIVLHGTFYVTHACGRRWLEANKQASVISIVTTWIETGSPFVVPSAMSKSGVAAMTRSLAVEWGGRGIRLNAIAPGPFPTKGAWDRLMPTDKISGDDSDSIPMGRQGDHSELANLATFLLADQCTYINGEVITIDGGQWLNGAGTFARLNVLDDHDWRRVRDAIREANQKDKAARA